MIRWLLTRDFPELDVGLFLGPVDEEEGRRFRHPGRHRQWVLGRVAAKVLLQRYAREVRAASCEPLAIRIRRTEEGWPEPLDSAGRRLPVSLTITHSGDQAFCAVCSEAEGTVGADMESVEPRSDAFLEDYYTEGERRQLQGLSDSLRQRMATVMWSIKEAVLKALRKGLALNPQIVDVQSLDPTVAKPALEPSNDSRLCNWRVDLLPSDSWGKAHVRLVDGIVPEVFWRLIQEDKVVLAVAHIFKGEENHARN